MRTTDPVFNVTFVGIIEKFPCLYALDSSDYNNRAVQEKAWEAVAREVNESVVDCKERWKNIRGCYTRYLKSVNSPGNGGKKQPYYLADPLNFLLQYTKSRKAVEYLTEPSLSTLEPAVKLEENGDDDGSGSFSQDGFTYDPPPSPEVRPERGFASPYQHKRPRLSSEAGHIAYNKEFRDEKKSEESDLAFLTSLLTDMKEMSRNQKRRFKIGILNLAGKILNERPPSLGGSNLSGSPSSPLNVNTE